MVGDGVVVDEVREEVVAGLGGFFCDFVDEHFERDVADFVVWDDVEFFD